MRGLWGLTINSERGAMLKFLEPESPNFDPSHAFLSSIEAEIITFFLKRQPFSFLGFYDRPINNPTWLPFQN